MDAIDVCLGGQFLVVCERNGNLHLIYVPQKKILLTRVRFFLSHWSLVLWNYFLWSVSAIFRFCVKQKYVINWMFLPLLSFFGMS